MDRRLRAFASAITTCERFCRDQTWRALLRANGEKPQISPLRFASVEMTNQVWLPLRTAQRESPSALAFFSVIPEGNLLALKIQVQQIW